eukprot:6471117-Amphidinium_carterae.4
MHLLTCDCCNHHAATSLQPLVQMFSLPQHLSIKSQQTKSCKLCMHDFNTCTTRTSGKGAKSSKRFGSSPAHKAIGQLFPHKTRQSATTSVLPKGSHKHLKIIEDSPHQPCSCSEMKMAHQHATGPTCKANTGSWQVLEDSQHVQCCLQKHATWSPRTESSSLVCMAMFLDMLGEQMKQLQLAGQLNLSAPPRMAKKTQG